MRIEYLAINLPGGRRRLTQSEYPLTREAPSTCGAQKQNSYVQPSVFDILAGASPASAMDGWAE